MDALDLDEYARREAELIQQQSGGRWLVQWGPYSRRFAYYLGPCPRPVVVDAATGGEMRRLLQAAAGDIRLASGAGLVEAL